MPPDEFIFTSETLVRYNKKGPGRVLAIFSKYAELTSIYHNYDIFMKKM